MRQRFIWPGVLSLVLSLSTAAVADDWPQIRGPHRDGVSSEAGLARSWPAGQPNEIWRRQIGAAFSGITVVDGHLITLESDAEHETALCLDAQTGKEIWRTSLAPLFVEEFGNGPRSTPTVADGVVYALTSNGAFHALRARDGSSVWKVELPEAYGSRVPRRGYSSSPLVDGDLVLVDVGGSDGRSLVAFDKATGKQRWATGDSPAGYSSPIAVDIGGVRQYVFARLDEPQIVSLLADGKVHWTHVGPPGVLTMPVFVPPDLVYLSSSDDSGAVLVRVGGQDGQDGQSVGERATEVWSTRSMKNHFSTSVLVGEHLYGFDNATFKSLSMPTAEQAWAKRGFGKGSLIAADGLLFVLSDRGLLALVEADPAGYREKGRLQALEGRAWTPPALADGRLFVRDQDEIVALDVRAGAAAGAAAKGAS